jgi:hypothetical protein
MLKLLRFNYFAEECNLNLLVRKDLEHFCHELNIKDYKIINESFLGFKSNMMLVIKKSFPKNFTNEKRKELY